MSLPFPVPLLLGAIALVLLVAALFYLFRATAPPYQQREEFLSPAELDFFRALEKAVDGQYYIFPKVRLGDLLCVTEGTENARAWFARIGQKHVDFVLADRESVRPVLIIELDDSSHQRPDRRERDQFVDGALASAGLAILHVPVQQSYSVEELGASINRMAGV